MFKVIHKDVDGNKIGQSDFKDQAEMDVHKVAYPQMWENKADVQDLTAEENQKSVNETAMKYLLATDWLLIRQVETGKPVPAEVLSERQAARDMIIK